MFDTLTDDERRALFLKLHDWAHEFYLIGHTLARTALAAGDFAPDSVTWTRRQQYCAARDELAELAELAA